MENNYDTQTLKNNVPHVTLPEITVYQPIQEPIPDFRDLAVKAAGYRWTSPREIKNIFVRDEKELSDPTDRALIESWRDKSSTPLERSAYNLLLNNGYQKFATDWFGNLVPASAITPVMKSIEHNWRMKHDRAYRDKYEVEGAAGEASNLDNFYNSQFDANDIIAQKNRIRQAVRQADRETANRTNGLEHALITIPASIIGGAAGLSSGVTVLPRLSSGAIAGLLAATAAGIGFIGGHIADLHDKREMIKNELNAVNDFLRLPIVHKTLQDAKTDYKKSRSIMAILRDNYTMGNALDKGVDKYRDPYNGSILPRWKKSLSSTIGDADGTPQETYLMDRDSQKKIFLSRGFKEVPGDYGLVKKAVRNRNIPVYQQNDDVITRDKLIPIGNLFSYWLGSEDTRLEHPGDYPTALYVGKDGNYYQKAWDLNDYGIDENKLDYLGLGRMGTYLDQIGSPTVVTTGFQKIDKEDLKQYLNEVDWTKEGKKIKKKLEKELKPKK